MSDDATLRALYQDVDLAGSLAAALQHALATQASRLTAERPLGRWFAVVKGNDRQCQVTVAARHRAFSSDFSHRGVGYGHVWNPELGVIAAAIARFVEGRAPIHEMVRAVPGFTASDAGRAHESGTLVEFTWQQLLTTRATYVPDTVVSLVRLASEIPALRRLLPFTSHDHLCFSRTDLSYSTDCPWMAAAGEGRYRTYAPPVNDERQLLVEGSAEEALAVLVKHLPTGAS
jgi:hypothetical protein